MNVMENAKLKGVTVKNHNNGWRVMFGDNLLFDTTKTETIEGFLNRCELVTRPDCEGLKIDGFMHFWIHKA